MIGICLRVVSQWDQPNRGCDNKNNRSLNKSNRSLNKSNRSLNKDNRSLKSEKTVKGSKEDYLNHRVDMKHGIEIGSIRIARDVDVSDVLVIDIRHLNVDRIVVIMVMMSVTLL